MSDFHSQPELDDELLSAYLDDELSPEERVAVEARVAADPAAEQLLHQLRAVSQAVQGLPQEAVGCDLRDAVLRKAGQRTPSGTAASSAAPPGAADDRSSANGEPDTPANSAHTISIGRTRRAWVWVSLAVAAALLIMVYDPGNRPGDELPAVAQRDASADREQLPSQLTEEERVGFRALSESSGEPSNEPAAPASVPLAMGDAAPAVAPESQQRWSIANAASGTAAGPPDQTDETSPASLYRQSPNIGIDDAGTSIAQENQLTISFGVDYAKEAEMAPAARSGIEPSAVPIAEAPSAESLAVITPDVKLTRRGVETPQDAPILRKETAAQVDTAEQTEQIAAGELIVVRVVATPTAIEGRAFVRLLERNGIQVETATSAKTIDQRRAAVLDGGVAVVDKSEVSADFQQAAERASEAVVVETPAETDEATDALLVEAPRSTILSCLESLYNDTTNYAALAVDNADTLGNPRRYSPGDVRLRYFNEAGASAGTELTEELGWRRFGRGNLPPSDDSLERAKLYLSYGAATQSDRYAAENETRGGRGGAAGLEKSRQSTDALTATKDAATGRARALRLPAFRPTDSNRGEGASTRADAPQGQVVEEGRRVQVGDDMQSRWNSRSNSDEDFLPVLFVLTPEEGPAPSRASGNRAE